MRMPTQIGRGRGGGPGGIIGALLGNRFGIILIAIAGLAFYWFSNQKEVPFTGRKQFNTIGIEEASQLGAQAYAQILQQEGGNVICAPGAGSCDMAGREVVSKVREIGERLEKAAIELEQEEQARGVKFTPVATAFDWTYNVIASDQPNAFCLPGGYVAVYTGILDITGNADGRVALEDLNDPDKLAVVMGHEIAHAMLHHGAERMSQQKVVQMGQMAVGLAIGDMDPTARQAVLGALGIAATGGVNAFSRAHESEADMIGLKLLVRACYDPREAPELWERMGKIGGGQRPPPWLSTHPEPEARAKAFEAVMPQAIAEYEARCGRLR